MLGAPGRSSTDPPVPRRTGTRHRPTRAGSVRPAPTGHRRRRPGPHPTRRAAPASPVAGPVIARMWWRIHMGTTSHTGFRSAIAFRFAAPAIPEPNPPSDDPIRCIGDSLRASLFHSSSCGAACSPTVFIRRSSMSAAFAGERRPRAAPVTDQVTDGLLGHPTAGAVLPAVMEFSYPDGTSARPSGSFRVLEHLSADDFESSGGSGATAGPRHYSRERSSSAHPKG